MPNEDYPIDQQLAEVLIACLDELEGFGPEKRDTIEWAERVLTDYYNPVEIV